jgi:hypothetical protein
VELGFGEEGRRRLPVGRGGLFELVDDLDDGLFGHCCGFLFSQGGLDGILVGTGRRREGGRGCH